MCVDEKSELNESKEEGLFSLSASKFTNQLVAGQLRRQIEGFHSARRRSRTEAVECAA